VTNLSVRFLLLRW